MFYFNFFQNIHFNEFNDPPELEPESNNGTNTAIEQLSAVSLKVENLKFDLKLKMSKNRSLIFINFKMLNNFGKYFKYLFTK